MSGAEDDDRGRPGPRQLSPTTTEATSSAMPLDEREAVPIVAHTKIEPRGWVRSMGNRLHPAWWAGDSFRPPRVGEALRRVPLTSSLALPPVAVREIEMRVAVAVDRSSPPVEKPADASTGRRPQVPNHVGREHPAVRWILQILIDTSESMGEVLETLTADFERLLARGLADPRLQSNLDVSIVTFGEAGVQILDPRTGRIAATHDDAFSPLTEVRLPTLRTGGAAPMFQAIDIGLDLLAKYADKLGAQGLNYLPRQELLTNGAPSDLDTGTSLSALAARIALQRRAHRLQFRVLALPGARTEVLDRLAGPEAVVDLSHLSLEGIFGRSRDQ